MAQALATHGVVLDSVDIRDVRQSDAAADQFAAAEADRVRPHPFQKGGGVAGSKPAPRRGFSPPPAPGSARQGGPQLVDVVQPLLAARGGIANAELARQAAVVQHQVADGGTDIEADGAEVAELGVDGLQAAFGNEDRPAVDIAVQQRFRMGKGNGASSAATRQLKLRRRRAGAATSASSSAGVAIALVDLIQVVKDQILDDLAHRRVNKLRATCAFFSWGWR